MNEGKKTLGIFFKFTLAVSLVIGVYLSIFLIAFFLAPDLANYLFQKIMVDYPIKGVFICGIYISGILWIKNLIYWYKFDKSALQLLLLVLINWIYSPFYYIRTQC
jgi:hypothetical protein